LPLTVGEPTSRDAAVRAREARLGSAQSAHSFPVGGETVAAKVPGAVEQSELELNRGGVARFGQEQPGRDIAFGGRRDAVCLAFVRAERKLEGDAGGGLIGRGMRPDLKRALPRADLLD